MVYQEPGDEASTDGVAVPEAVVALAGTDAIDVVWRNQLGGLTFRVDAGLSTDRYIKWVPAGTPEIDLRAEAERLSWLAGRFPVPKLLACGVDSNGAWLMGEAIPASSAVSPRWKAEPATAVAAVGAGLRTLHEAVRIDDCPFRWDHETRLNRARRRLDAGEGPERWFPEHRGLTAGSAWATLEAPPPIDRLVVCHGDACAPNTLVNDDGTFAAIVDVGSLGVADRWADLAVAAWSTEWNYGPGFDGLLYDAYGIRPDPERIAYYRLLWDLT